MNPVCSFVTLVVTSVRRVSQVSLTHPVFRQVLIPVLIPKTGSRLAFS
jgi:hypothetical protein